MQFRSIGGSWVGTHRARSRLRSTDGLHLRRSALGVLLLVKDNSVFLLLTGRSGRGALIRRRLHLKLFASASRRSLQRSILQRGEVSQAGPSGRSTTRLVCRFPERGAVDLQYQKLLVAPWVVQISATSCEGDGCLFLAVQNSWHGEKDSTLTAHTKEGLAKVMGSVAPPNKPGFPSPHSAASA
jgi:hypothetical protein